MPAPEPLVKAVIDTSVLVSGILSSKGTAARILDAGYAGRFVMVVSPTLLDEYLDVLLRPMYGISAREAAAVVATVRNRAFLVGGTYHGIEMVRTDPKDNHIVACALEGDAEYLITNDRRDLLPLKDHHVAGHRVLHVVTPNHFVKHVLAM